MLSANHFSEFLIQLYLKQEQMNQLDLWHADTGNVMLKVVCKLLVGYDHKLSWQLNSEILKSAISQEQPD